MTSAQTEVLTESAGIIAGDIIKLTYGDSALRVQIVAAPIPISVYFADVAGFRMLDERELTEFWSHQEYDPKACLYLVCSGGWLELEKSRPAFNTGFLDGVQEYLLTSNNECLSVLATSRPKIIKDDS